MIPFPAYLTPLAREQQRFVLVHLGGHFNVLWMDVISHSHSHFHGMETEMKETYIRRQTVAIVRREGPSDRFGGIISFGKLRG